MPRWLCPIVSFYFLKHIMAEKNRKQQTRAFCALKKLILQVTFLARNKMAAKQVKTAEEAESARLTKNGKFGTVCIVFKDRLSGRWK